MSRAEEVESAVRAILVKQCAVSASAIRRDASLAGDLGLDSMMMLVLATELENQFRLLLNEQDAAQGLETVGDLIDLATLRLEASERN